MAKISLQNRIFGTVKAFTLKGILLTTDDYRTLAESRDLDEFLTRLKNTKYLEAVSQIQKPFTASTIELALKSDLIDYHAMMNRIAMKSDIISAYFNRYMVWNLKLILKGKALNKQEEEIRSKLNLRAEEIMGKRDVIVRALVGKDLDEAVASLSQTEYGRDLQEAVRIYRERNDIQVFDTYLDHVFYNKLYNSILEAENEVKGLVMDEIDAYNMLSILRSKFWKLKEEQINELIVGKTPSLSRDTMQKMIVAYNLQDAISILANTSYRNMISQYLTDEIATISAIEQALEAALLKECLATYLKPFKEANILAAIKVKSIEIRNISAIATGVEQKIPTDTIMQKIVKLK
ncbi:MAG: V-type ATPase subunit [Candidatus Nitrosocaldaceae archaeon]